MKPFRSLVGFVAFVLVVAHTPLGAQVEGLPLAPNDPSGQPVAPFFEGWYANPDGTYTYSFGYFNLNTRETVEIPLGENNFIEPAEFDGAQPTSFPTRRQRGVFTVTVPGSMAGSDVVWTLRGRGHTLSVPGRTTAPAYELGYLPMAGGSMPPTLKFDPDGTPGYGVLGLTLDRTLTTAVGDSLPLTIWFDDTRSKRDPVALNVSWFKHSGPVRGTVTFDPAEHEDVEDGQATVVMTFSQPGEYVVRTVVDNFNAGDSSDGDQCCWTVGKVRVVVTE